MPSELILHAVKLLFRINLLPERLPSLRVCSGRGRSFAVFFGGFDFPVVNRKQPHQFRFLNKGFLITLLVCEENVMKIKKFQRILLLGQIIDEILRNWCGLIFFGFCLVSLSDRNEVKLILLQEFDYVFEVISAF